MAIRKFQSKVYTAEQLIHVGALTKEVMTLLQSAVHQRRNILVAGATGTGKTTLLNALARSIPDEQRICVIEDTAECSRNLIFYALFVLDCDERKKPPGSGRDDAEGGIE